MAETTTQTRRHTGGKKPLNEREGGATRKTVRLLDEQLAALDELARRRGVSPSRVLREALERELEREGLTA